jgi:hypothetical protein
MGAEPAPEVFTLVPPDHGPGPPIGSLEQWQQWQRLGRFPRGQGVGDWHGEPPPPAQWGGGLVFRRYPDGGVTVDGFPEEADVCEPLVARLDPRVVLLERGRLYVEAANGAAVYVLVGDSPRPGCRRYDRLYRRLTDSS